VPSIPAMRGMLNRDL